MTSPSLKKTNKNKYPFLGLLEERFFALFVLGILGTELALYSILPIIFHPVWTWLIPVNIFLFLVSASLFFFGYKKKKHISFIKHFALTAIISLSNIQFSFIHNEIGFGIFYFPIIILLILGLHGGHLTYKQFVGYFGYICFSLSIGGGLVDVKAGATGMFIWHLIFANLLSLLTLYMHILVHRAIEMKAKSETELNEKMRQVVKVFSSILSREKNMNELLWDVANQCIPTLELEDCVIYLVDSDRNLLIQKAAFGNKSHLGNMILQPIDIPVGKGIVGSVAKSGEPEIIVDTTKDPRYIPDDQMRYSEISVPIVIGDKVIGVIDSEHPQKNYFNSGHLYLLQIVASLCANKITELESRKVVLLSEEYQKRALRLEELDIMKSKFISNISHDLKTPLTLILGPSEKLVKEAKERSTREMAVIIQNNAQHLKKIIDQLVELNEVEFMLQKLDVQKLQVSSLFQNWISQYRLKAEAKNISLNIQGPVGLVIPCDEKKLSAIFHNLVDNAIKYTPEHGTVNVLFLEEKDYFILQASDSGPGIPLLFREKIFERFFRLGDADGQGSGIGLSLVKDLAEVLGAKLTVGESNLKGSLFSISLNLTYLNRFLDKENLSLQPSEKAIDFTDAVEEGKPLLLIVEDNTEMRSFIKSSLIDEFNCIEAKNGEEGVDIALKTLPDIIITDLMMPVLDGEGLCRRLKSEQATNHIPIIALSAKSQVASRVELYNLGADNYLTKPFSPVELKAVLNGQIKLREQLRNKFKTGYTINEPDNSKTPDNAFLKNATTFILKNLEDIEYGVKELGEDLLLNRNQLQRKIKALTDMTPVEFLRYIRLKEAEKLLKTGTLNVSEVAYKVGFNNLSWFTKSFKEVTGKLPSDLIHGS